MVFGRKSVETETREARVALNHSLDQLFEGKHIKLKLKPKKKKKKMQRLTMTVKMIFLMMMAAWT